MKKIGSLVGRSVGLTLFAALVLFVVPSRSLAWEAKCVAVYDGDTITVLQNGREVHIRLYGVDTPEKHQAFGLVSQRFAADLVLEKVVSIETVSKDMHGRTVGLVTIDGKLLNRELVRGGFAWYFAKYCDRKELCKEFEHLEQKARDEERGLWAQDNPTPPWVWRRIYRTVPPLPKPYQPKKPKALPAHTPPPKHD